MRKKGYRDVGMQVDGGGDLTFQLTKIQYATNSNSFTISITLEKIAVPKFFSAYSIVWNHGVILPQIKRTLQVWEYSLMREIDVQGTNSQLVWVLGNLIVVHRSLFKVCVGIQVNLGYTVETGCFVSRLEKSCTSLQYIPQTIQSVQYLSQVHYMFFLCTL